VQVEFIGETIDPFTHKPWNLHSVWDSGILEVRDPDAHHYAERLNAWLNTQPDGAFQDGSMVDWAMESHNIAKEYVYVLPLDLKLGEEYYRANVPVVDQQLAKAGARLAKLLNDALGKK
jgi:nuclease S1